MLKEIGLYYIPENDLVIIGFKNLNSHTITGRVICNLKENYLYHTFSVGYKYNNWTGTYIGRLAAYSTLKGYLDFINLASYNQIKMYFKVKKKVEKYLSSYLRKHGDLSNIKIRSYLK